MRKLGLPVQKRSFGRQHKLSKQKAPEVVRTLKKAFLYTTKTNWHLL